MATGTGHKQETAFVNLFQSSPLYDFIIPFRKAPNQWVARYIVIVFAVIIRCAVGLGSYSGESTPPMFGDFEAQRHWMEITNHLPLSQWYFYDLQYWGLDYPPLTAFHSWLCGFIGKFIQSSWFALDESRGFESMDLKTYMRITALASELAIYIPAVVMFVRWSARNYTLASSINQTIITAAILFQPSLIIIDHGHFQYNSIMLGFTLLSLVHLLQDDYAVASALFVLAIGFKQMALYYSPIFFFYLLSRCIYPTFNIWRFSKIAMSVIITILTLILPFILLGDINQPLQIIHRMFPFARGLFEDKVANFWCATNVLIKYGSIFTGAQLRNLSLSLTILNIFPACLVVFITAENPTIQKRLLPWCLSSCSLAFYLFSFQVHEKSILLPWLPITLLLAEVDADVISMVCWFLNMALFSMLPLLRKDGLTLQYCVLGLLSNWLMGNLSWIRKYASLILPVSKRPLATPVLPHSLFWKIVIVGSYISAAMLQIVEIFVYPPLHLPDLWVIVNVFISFASFALFFLWLNYKICYIAAKSLKQKSE